MGEAGSNRSGRSKSMRRRLNRKVAIGAVAVAALVGGGGAVAATQFDPEAEEQAIIEDAAGRLGVQPAELSEALEQAYAARVDQAVADGRLTEEQAAELKERLAEGDVPLVGGPMLHGHGPGHGGMLHGLDAAATYLDLSEAELRDALRGGQTLAEIAVAQGKTDDGLEQALLQAATERLDEAVVDDRLTEERRQEILENLPDRIDDLVNGELPRFGPGHGRGHGPLDEEDAAGAA